jgi:putative transposase
MAQSLANVLVHVIFSTKNRAAYLKPELEHELFSYLASIFQASQCPAAKIGGTDDHVHVVCSLARTITIADLLEEVKKSSSKWLKTKGPKLTSFAWQNGYGAFSIGQSQLAVLKNYIARQREHHQRKTFQEEFR